MSLVAKYWQRVLAEFVGTTLFIFAVASSVVIPLTYLQAVPGVISLITAFIQGLALIAVVSMFSWVSGSHFNPAITATTMLIGKMGIFLGFFYIVAQVVGAILGAAIFRGCASLWQPAHLSAVAVGPGVSLGQAFLVEFMITTILLMVVVGTSTDTRQGLYILAPVPIGFSVLLGVLIARTLTGASMNPARALGPAIVGHHFDNHWLYWVAPLASAILVSILYRLLFHVQRGGRMVNVTEQAQAQAQAVAATTAPMTLPASTGTAVGSSG